MEIQQFINYNFMSKPAKFCLDLDDATYKLAGISRSNPNAFDIVDMKDGDILFVKTDFIQNGFFQTQFLPKINKRFILVTGASDYSIDSGNDIHAILNNDYLIRWFCTNPSNFIEHNKLGWLPIGFQEKERIGGNVVLLNEKFNSYKNWNDKENKIYIPYHNTANDIDRERLLAEVASNHYCVRETNKLQFGEYLDTLNNYKYVLSLRGNGWDCHRHYESLLVGSVPILQTGPIFAAFNAHNLPAIEVQEINENIFNRDLDFSNVKEFLTMKYHINRIETCAY